MSQQYTITHLGLAVAVGAAISCFVRCYFCSGSCDGQQSTKTVTSAEKSPAPVEEKKYRQIEVGDKLPEVKFNIASVEDAKSGDVCSRRHGEAWTSDLFKDKKVVLFAVPAAFTPTCSEVHVPGFLANYDALRAKGVDKIILTSVNDAFVLTAWGAQMGVGNKIVLAGDSSGEFARQIGLTFDLTKHGLGIRSKRYAMIVDNQIVTFVGVGEPKDNSGAEVVLANL